MVGTASVKIGSTGEALGHATTGGVSAIGRSLSDAVDRTAHTPESLAVFLNTRVYAGKQAHKRSRHWWGRIYNKFSGENAHYVKLKGLHLIQTLRVINNVPQDREIPITANCAIRLDFTSQILHELLRQLADKSAESV